LGPVAVEVRIALEVLGLVGEFVARRLLDEIADFFVSVEDEGAFLSVFH